MTSSPFDFRRLAHAYCDFVLRHFGFLGIDKYQILLMTFLLGGLCSIAFLASGRMRDAVNRFCPPWLYSVLLVFALFLIRLPTLLPGTLNPDEGMFLAGAMKLRHYPVFWESLDGTTSGPLNYYPLTLMNLLGLPLDFATARLLNVICVGGAIAVVYGIARLLMADWSARLTPLPALAAAMLFRSPYFLHYSSECVSVLMIAFATWLLFADHLSARASLPRGLGIGAVAAFLPLAKIQAAPIALIVAIGGIVHGLLTNQPQKWRRALYVLMGLAAGAATLGFFLIAFGVFGPFWQSYVAMNFLHANMYPPVSLKSFLSFCLFWDIKWYAAGMVAWLVYLFVSSYFPWGRRKGYRLGANQFIGTLVAVTMLYYAGVWWFSSSPGFTLEPALSSLLVGLTAGLIWTVLRYRAIVLKLCFLDIFVFCLLASSLYAVYRPRSLFYHYLVFLVFPIALVGARTFGWSLRVLKSTDGTDTRLAALRIAGLFVLLTLGLSFFPRRKELMRTRSEKGMALLPAQLECAPCQLMNQFAKPGDLVAVWGWAPELYVETGTLPATRDSHTPFQMTYGGPLLGYFRDRFMEDLQLHPPKVFVDAVGPGQFNYHDRDAYGYETFPALREYVDRNFYLAGDLDGVRVFARK
jgi:hypothetical protein